MRKASVLVMAFIYLAACSTSSRDTYTASETGDVLEVAEGRVVTSRIVEVESEDTGFGAAAGGFSGGLGTAAAFGGQIGIAAFILGSLIGATIGYFTEDAIKDGEGIEYVVALKDGRYVTIVQNHVDGEDPLPVDAEVLVQYGATYTRVLQRPQEMGPSESDTWINPDDLWINPDDLSTETDDAGPEPKELRPTEAVPSPSKATPLEVD